MRNMLNRSKLPYKPRLFYRGLALVLVPFLLGSLLLIMLNGIWSLSEKALKNENQQCLLVRLLSGAFSSWGDATARSIDKTVQSNVSSKNKRRTQVGDWFTWTELEAGSEPQSLANVKRLETIYVLESETLKSLPQMSSAGSIDLTAMQKLPTVLARIYKLRTEVGVLLNEEWTRLRYVREQGDSTRTRMRYILYGCCAGNVALAVLLGYLFSRSITSRLKILMINAACLPKNQKFPEQVKGDDELAYLDKVLSGAAAQLEAAAEHRRAIVGMVAHDMRSPLMAAQTSLQLLEEIGGDYSDESLAEFDTAFNSLSGILSYVHELLSAQKTGKDTEEANEAKENRVSRSTEVKVKGGWNLSLITRAGAEFLFRPRVLQQGLLLVLLPLIFQTTLLLMINQQILQSDTNAARMRRLSDSIMDGQFLQINMVRASIAEAIYIFTSKERFQKLATKIFQEIGDQLVRMEAAAGNDSEAIRLLKESKKVFSDQEARIMTVKPSDSPDAIIKVFEDVSEVNTKSPKAWKLRRDGAIRRIQENAKLDNMEDERNESAQLVSESFGWSLLANLGLAAGLLFMFNRNMRKRLNILVANASRLGMREPLKEAVKGTDEFAFLDLSLHHAEAQINDASAQRAAMMFSLAQEMRVPLHDAQYRLKNFEALSRESLPQRCANYLQKAQRNIDRVLALIENLLTMESLSTGRVHLERSNCNTRKVAEEALATVASLAQKKNIILENKCESTDIYADNDKLVQVLVNLLGNAIKFSPEGTLVRVSGDVRKESFSFSVQDHGPGMDAETKDNVFEKFYQAQTEQKEQGFGLGLAICKLIVESHGGTIGVDSALGVGTTFWFELPSSEPILHNKVADR